MTVVGNLLIRADADRRIGTGHVMRMLALADAWQAAGGKVAFASNCPAESIRRRIEATGAEFLPMQKRHPHPDDLTCTRAFLKNRNSQDGSPPTWVALDGYHFDLGYQRGIRGTERRLLVVDDTAQNQRYDADILLNQNLGAERLAYVCDSGLVLLLGTRYALLRGEFRRRQPFRRETPEMAKRLLVTLGGADPKNVTIVVLKALALVDVPGLEAKVVVGTANRHLELLEEHVRSRSKTRPAVSIELLTDVADMSELMVWADVGIGAAGSTCWEMVMMRLPSLVTVVADNQRAIADRLTEVEAVTSLGEADELSPQRIAVALTSLCHDRRCRQRQAEIASGLIDGRGPQRVVDAMRSFDGPLPEGRALSDPGVFWSGRHE